MIHKESTKEGCIMERSKINYMFQNLISNIFHVIQT